MDSVVPDDPIEEDEPDWPRQRSASVEDAGMGDLLRFDASRLRILLERHLLFTGSARARELLEDWESAAAAFVKIMPKDYRRALLELQAERQAASVAARAMTASADG
jgi:glutamate synthase (NADPH/NADH) large chain